jgi:lipopolysaccharide transport system ATP-binding protein
MCSDIAIKVDGVSKCYEIYPNPLARLIQFINPTVRKLIGFKKENLYREFWALKNVTFEVKKGETVGIIGRNGSGKSTLLQLICDTLNPSSGDIETTGRIAALLELGSGFNPEFTGKENVYLNASVLGLTKEEIDDRFTAICEFADIGDFLDQPVKTYSSGMTVRLAFAVIAHVNADILIIDEALAVGDVFFTQKCMRFLRDFMRNGTVLFVSHDTGAILNLCNRAILLDKGEIKQIGESKDVAKEYVKLIYGDKQNINRLNHSEVNADKKKNFEFVEYKDIRSDFINRTNLRNDIEIFQFKKTQEDFGAGGAEIITVQLQDGNGAPLSWVVGGTDVILEIKCQAQVDICSPIIGFQFHDKLGQIIFGDNTYITYADSPVFINNGEEFRGKFKFRFPILPSGDYSLTVAVANGSQNEHTQMHWVNDAIVVKVHASSICFGLVGIPMQDIELIVN